jgi:hypothetical protein
VAVDAVIIQTYPLTLDTVCDGKLAKQVDAALARVAEAFEDVALQQGRTKLEAKVNVEIALAYDCDSGAVKLAGKVKPTLPEHRAVGGTAMLRGGKFLVEPDDEQMDLVDHIKTRSNQ